MSELNSELLTVQNREDLLSQDVSTTCRLQYGRLGRGTFLVYNIVITIRCSQTVGNTCVTLNPSPFPDLHHEPQFSLQVVTYISGLPVKNLENQQKSFSHKYLLTFI